MQMRAARVNTPGGIENIKIEQMPIPEPRNDEIRAKILYAGVSFPDIMVRQGSYPPAQPPFPLTLGYEGIGVIDKIGSNVPSNKFKEGDRVGIISVSGNYAEYVCAKHIDAYKIDPNLDPSEEVCLVLNYMTCYQMLTRAMTLKKGERILVHGIAGGVGTAFIEFGKRMGLEIYGTCSTSKCAKVKEMGVNAIDYTKEDFVDVISKLNPPGVDAVFDPIGGDNWTRSYRCLRRGGRFIAYGLQSGLKATKFQNLKSMMKFVSIKLKIDNHGPAQFYGINTYRNKHNEWYVEDLATMCDLLSKKEIQPIISSKLKLEEAAEAQKLLESGKIIGRIVLVI